MSVPDPARQNTESDLPGPASRQSERDRTHPCFMKQSISTYLRSFAEKLDLTAGATTFAGHFDSFEQARQVALKQRKHLAISEVELKKLRSDNGVDSRDSRAEEIVLRASIPNTKVVDIGGRLSHLRASGKTVGQTAPIAFNQSDWVSVEWYSGLAPYKTGIATSQVNGLTIKPELGCIAYADAIISWGVMPYLETDLVTLLLTYDALPMELVLSDLAITEQPTFVTLHQSGHKAAPYRVENREQLTKQLAGFGYHVVEDWQASSIEFSLRKHQDCTFSCFYGIHLRHESAC